MDAIKQPVKQVVNPGQATNEKQQAIMTKQEQQEKKDGQIHVDEPSSGNQKVRDPVTGEHMTLKDATEQPEEIPQGENILRMPFPPPDLISQREYLISLFSTTVSRMTLAFTIVPILTFTLAPTALTNSRPLGPLFLLIPSLGIPAALSMMWMYRMQSKGDDDADRRAWDVERERGLQGGYDKDGDGKIDVEEKKKESAEWLNALLKGVWPIINPDMFTSLVDMLEDIMQASVPTFIHSVRIPDLGLGNNPIRITSLRALPDDDADLTRATDTLKDDERELIKGEHVNWELGFAYRAAPNKTKWHEKAQNFHLLVEFYLGIKGVAAIPIPVWAEITGMVGTARLRIELIPDPPFVKHTLITLTGQPKVSISITPIHKKLLPNMMDIPFISRFISDSINAAAKEYIAPKSLMLDLQQLLSGDGISRDTVHIGVVVVHVHKVVIEKGTESDIDAYVNICLSPMNKTQYTTRIISGTRQPVFEETTVLLVDANAAKIGEKVSLQVWDSDRFTADDMLGHVEIDISELISKHNEAFRRIVPMKHALDNKESGTMEFTVGFFSKVPPGADDSNSSIPQSILESAAFKKARKSTLSDLEAAVAVTPPNEDYLSGILGIQIHEIRELGVREDNMAASQHSGKGSSEKPEGEEEVEAGKGLGLPSPYCTVMINDEPVYRTRTKPMTSTPFFNASTERFIRDWKAAHICVVVRDSRLRENDPIMGMVFFKLPELFKEGSMATGSWSLQHGIGFGRIHLSFVFRPVQLTMPPSLVGFDTGTVQVKSVNVKFFDPELEGNTDVRLTTSGGYTKIKKGISSADADKEKEKSKESLGEDGNEEDGVFMHLPVQTRYHSALVLNARKKGILHRSTVALGMVWLRDLIDDHHDGIVKATLWKASDLSELKQNYSQPNDVPFGLYATNEKSITGQNDGKDNKSNGGKPKAVAVGEVELQVVFKPGISDSHEKDMKEDPTKMKSWEEYVIMKREGLRKNIGRGEADPHPLLVPTSNQGPGGSAQTNTGGASAPPPPQNFATDKVEVVEPRELGSEVAGSSSGSLGDKIKSWTDHQDNLSSEHRGMKQFKGVRTAEWLLDGARDAVLGAAGRMKRKEKLTTMEKEA